MLCKTNATPTCTEHFEFFLAITLIRTADNVTKLAWKVLISMRCKTYFLPYKYSLYHNWTIRRNSSDNQVKHIRNKIVTPEWRTDQCVSLTLCLQWNHSCAVPKILNPRTSGVRLNRNLVYKFQKQFLDGYTYRTSFKRERGALSKPLRKWRLVSKIRDFEKMFLNIRFFILEYSWQCIMVFVNCRYLTFTDIVPVVGIISKLVIQWDMDSSFVYHVDVIWLTSLNCAVRVWYCAIRLKYNFNSCIKTDEILHNLRWMPNQYAHKHSSYYSAE